MNSATTQKQDNPSVHSIDHFCISVPDLEQARFFYTEFGLDVRETAEGLELFTFGNAHRWGVIRKGERKKLEYLSFGIYEEDVEPFRNRLKELGIAQTVAPFSSESGGIWFRNPDGLTMQLRVAEKCTPDSKAEFLTRSVGPGECAAIPRSKAPRVYPRRLSHFLMFSSDVLRDIDFYRNVIGLKLSDHSDGIIAFMHGAHGSDHHLLAIAKADGPGMHHSSWDVGTVQEVGLGGEYMTAKGFDRGWGMGQHVLGANYFWYVRDPWNSYAEYSCDIDFIPAGFDWPAGDHPPEDSLYLWGPAVPEDFVVNYELQDA